jgi:hypothetical protein
MKKPSDFAKVSNMASVLQKAEAEIVASNIMVILKRTGDKWRRLGWREYEKERQLDGQFHQMEQLYFDKVKNFCTTAEKAATFCPGWKRVLNAE